MYWIRKKNSMFSTISADGEGSTCQRFMPPGMMPIVTGGTGFYIQALLYDIQFTDRKSQILLTDRN